MGACCTCQNQQNHDGTNGQEFNNDETLVQERTTQQKPGDKEHQDTE